MTGKGRRLVPSPSFSGSPLPAMDFLLRPQVRGACYPLSLWGQALCASPRPLVPRGCFWWEWGWAMGEPGDGQEPYVQREEASPLVCSPLIRRSARPSRSSPHLAPKTRPSPQPFSPLSSLFSLLAPPWRGLHTPALGDPDALQVQKLLSKYLAAPGAKTVSGWGAGPRLPGQAAAT